MTHITTSTKKEYQGITKTSRDLLTYWTDEDRDNKLFLTSRLEPRKSYPLS